MKKTQSKSSKPKSRSKDKTSPLEMPVPDDRETVTIKKISNGYIIEKSGVKNGHYFSSEKYSPTDPLKGSTKS